MNDLLNDAEALKFLRDVHLGRDGTGEEQTPEELGLKLQRLPSIPRKANPFHHDSYHMGTRVHENLMVMHGCEKDGYIILYFPQTGERIRVQFDTVSGRNSNG